MPQGFSIHRNSLSCSKIGDTELLYPGMSVAPFWLPLIMKVLWLCAIVHNPDYPFVILDASVFWDTVPSSWYWNALSCCLSQNVFKYIFHQTQSLRDLESVLGDFSCKHHEFKQYMTSWKMAYQLVEHQGILMNET